MYSYLTPGWSLKQNRVYTNERPDEEKQKGGPGYAQVQVSWSELKPKTAVINRIKLHYC